VWVAGLPDLGAHPSPSPLLLAAPPGRWRCRPNSRAPYIDVDEHASLPLRFDTGLDVHITVSWRHPDADDRVWDLQAASATGVLRVELSPNLALEIDGEVVPLPAPRSDLPTPKLEQMGYAPQLERLLDDFDAGRTPEMGASFGREVLDILCAAYRSAGRGGQLEPLPFGGPRDRTPLELWRLGPV
jgi:predicted dehydrogenase